MKTQKIKKCMLLFLAALMLLPIIANIFMIR